MTTIGTFRRDGEDFVGRVSTLMIDATVRLVAVEKVSASAPTFRAFVGEAECGAAWRPTDPASSAVLNVKLDDPTWPDPIHARLMAGEDAHALVWIRRQEERPKEAVAHEPRPRAAPG